MTGALPLWYWIVAGAIIGGCMASFLGVVLERAPLGESLNGRSRCACGRQLKVAENIPVAGWLLARGIARCCRTPIPVKHPIGETIGMLVGAGLAGYAGILGILGILGITTGMATATALRHRGKRRP